jgi:sigma-B regulation protein RsbU (phosphoserine phosphatase)
VAAGHPPVLFAAAGSTTFEPIGEGSLPVGILPDAAYEARLVTLAPGSRLALYSDGITECSRADGLPFGLQRLQDLLVRERSHTAAAGFSAIREALHAWHGGTFEDDVTLLLLESR